MSKMRKRDAPDAVAPAIINAMRIEAVHYGHDLGVEQNGGYIAAYDQTTNERLWFLQIYDTQYNKAREIDVQDVFIHRLIVCKQGLKVVDEMNRRFLVDVTKKTVVRLS